MLDLSAYAFNSVDQMLFWKNMPLRLPALRYVDMDVTPGLPLLALFPVFSLPSIESIGLRRATTTPLRLQYIVTWAPRWAGVSSQVKHLLLDQVDINRFEWHIIAHACRALISIHDYGPWVEGLGIQHGLHIRHSRPYRCEIRTLHPPCLFYIEAPDAKEEMDTPWPLEDRGDRGYFRIVGVGAREAWRLAIAVGVVGSTPSVQQPDPLASFKLALYACAWDVADEFPHAAVLTICFEEMDLDMANVITNIVGLCLKLRLHYSLHLSRPPHCRAACLEQTGGAEQEVPVHRIVDMARFRKEKRWLPAFAKRMKGWLRASTMLRRFRPKQ
ncbi:hypothetical protein BU26DRAFT_212291 [Trematosphaeria pertusa]|uniref:Uncharacterized protein n=1 Tax=Trematosphaeria pertusa TaxID=390896 RepID=A0A6A6IS51_9PLEO|nr:uncharacterized protein BU26DRAFT_212291 [Trematosphaeria pertusa]KAF2252967.1 hypothetical protein BU26DRAFT_212291 [Trematosphaeria pertusa]